MLFFAKMIGFIFYFSLVYNYFFYLKKKFKIFNRLNDEMCYWKNYQKIDQ